MEWVGCLCIVLFAQSDKSADPISGGAGWVGAGLLGAILAWLLLKRLPDSDKQLEKLIDNKDKQLQLILDSKDKQTRDMLDAKDEQMKSMMDGRNQVVKDLTTMFIEQLREARNDGREARKEFREALDRILAQFDRHIDSISNTLKTEMEEIINRLLTTK